MEGPETPLMWYTLVVPAVCLLTAVILVTWAVRRALGAALDRWERPRHDDRDRTVPR